MKKLLLLPVLLLALANLSMAEMMVSEPDIFRRCKVGQVLDGNTIACDVGEGGVPASIYLYQIDAPELDQPFGEKAKKSLSDMIYSEEITIENKGMDKYKRILGIVIFSPCFSNKRIVGCGYLIPEEDYNYKMIKQGYAWFDPSYGENPVYQQAEQEARAAKRGLWADENPIPPWEWRAKKKK